MAGVKGVYLGIGVAVLVGGAAFIMAQGGAARLPTGPISTGDIEAGRAFPGYIDGSPDAPVEIVEYADFECPACRQAWILTVRDIKARLVQSGQVRYIFRDFPLDMHPKARIAHHAAACADEQGFFWQMHDQLFNAQGQWAAAPGSGERQFEGYAESISGLDVDAYNQCMESGRYRGRIQASFERGGGDGVGSTPTFFIGGQRYSNMPYDQVKAIVDSLSAVAP